MKILWHSNAPWAPTGYGQQTKLFTPRLVAAGHDLAISSFYGLEGDRLNWENDIQVYPSLGNEFGNDYLIRNAESRFGDPRGGLVLTLMDVWVLHPQMAAQLDMACWVPIDHVPVPPLVAEFFATSGAIPIAMSKFGRDELRLVPGLDPLYVPHGVETDVFKPHDRAEARDYLGADPDAFLIGMVAANKGAPSRKCFVEALQAFSAFRERHENAVLYLHTELGGDEQIPAIIESLQIPEGSIQTADQYRMALRPLPKPIMANLYSTFDVLLNPSAGEGFGVPVLEAAACGVPSIVTNFTAMPEVAGPGWKVSCAPTWTGQRSWQARPSVSGIIDALEECYALTPDARAALSGDLREHALAYDADRVTEEHFLPVLAEIERRLEARKPAAIAVPA